SYSAHADYEEIIRFLGCQDKSKIRNIFLVHGETDVKVEFKDILVKEGFENVMIPLKGETVKLK
ncbi:MAG: MBL fold metallo-hydrolase RNA specificity domain-containing protein, partial [Sphingobacteriaceae bacterium]